MASENQINIAVKIAIIYVIFFTALVRSESQTRISFFFTISSGQNSTGHRHVKAVCNIPAGSKPITGDDFRLDVQQMTHFVENIKFLQLTTSFNGTNNIPFFPGFITTVNTVY
ncbi:hypothetical protein R5R35_009040 [Gryllus longicercus]|uniref:Uncharacterized protein n=1 Tax=Gryllus longicercus TaxID=2509291 RepID=A0AAN9WEW0_9ORTH